MKRAFFLDRAARLVEHLPWRQGALARATGAAPPMSYTLARLACARRKRFGSALPSSSACPFRGCQVRQHRHRSPLLKDAPAAASIALVLLNDGGACDAGV